MDPITIAVCAAVVGGATAGTTLLAWVAIKRHNRKYLKLWTEAAARVGGELVPPAGPWYKRTPMTIKARLHDVEVTVDHYIVTTGNVSQTFTRCRARALGAADLKLVVKRKSVISGLGRTLGFQDLPTSDPAFDDRFVVKASDEDLALAWLDLPSREALMPLEKYEVELKASELKAVRANMENDPSTLVLVMDAVAALASGGHRIMERWREMAVALEGTLLSEVAAWDPEAGVKVETELRGARVVVEAAGDQIGRTVWLRTFVKCHLVTSGAERLAVFRGASWYRQLQRVELPPDRLPGEYKVLSEAPEDTARRLTSELCRRLADLSPAFVDSEGQTVRVALDGVVLNAEIIAGAADLALDLASTFSEGVYR